MSAAPIAPDPLQIRAGEHGTLRVFDVDLPDALATKLASLPFERESALGVPLADAARTEMFDVASLGDLGLGRYLHEGLGIAEQEIEENSKALGNIAGYVLILRAGAVAGPAQLAPIEGLRLAALLHEERAQLSFEKIYSSSTEGILTPAAVPDASGTGAQWGENLRLLRRWLGLLVICGLAVTALIWSLT